jgi:predicted MPP superfamily phosphohydrolase
MTSRSLFRIAILLAIFFYSKWKFAQVFNLSEPMAWLAAFLVFVVMIAWLFTYRYETFAMNSWLFQIVTWGGSLVMALWTTLMILFLFVDIAGLGAFLVQKALAGASTDFSRRGFLFTWLPTLTLGAAGIMVAAGLRQVFVGAQIKRVKIPSPKITNNLEGFKIAQISDLHVGPTIQRKYVEDLANKVLAEKPDLIAITGDLIDGSPAALKEFLEPLKSLQAPHGVYYITGNHEYYWGAERWIKTISEMGIIPLINENKILNIKGHNLMIAGVTDPSAHEFIPEHRSDAIKAVKSSEDTAYKILLAHRPESYADAEKAGFDLQLSGHTHAGQFFPASLFIPFFHRYYKGLNKHNEMFVYVNTGSGYWGPPDRFGVPAEITILELVQS